MPPSCCGRWRERRHPRPGRRADDLGPRAGLRRPRTAARAPGAASSPGSRVTDYGPGLVRPHERTQPGPKEDRLRLTRATGYNLSPIFVLHSGDAWSRLAPALADRALRERDRRRRHRPPRLADRRSRGPRGGRRGRRRLRAADRRRPPSLRDRTDLRATRSAPRPATTPATRSPAWSRSRIPGLSVFATHRLLHDLDDDQADRPPRHARRSCSSSSPIDDPAELVPGRRATARSPSATWTPSTASPTACASRTETGAASGAAGQRREALPDARRGGARGADPERRRWR